MIEVSMVPPQLLDTCWGKIEAYLDKAAKYTYGRYSVNDIYEAIKDGDNVLWVAFDAGNIVGAVVTSMVTYPRKKALCMQFCGGVDLKNWKDPMLALLRRYAEDMGCEIIEATARKGWAKVFELDGYKQNWVTFELPVNLEKHHG